MPTRTIKEIRIYGGGRQNDKFGDRLPNFEYNELRELSHKTPLDERVGRQTNLWWSTNSVSEWNEYFLSQNHGIWRAEKMFEMTSGIAKSDRC